MNKPYTGAAAILLLTAGAGAQQWEELSPGSASFPAAIRIENFDSVLDDPGRVSIRPKTGVTKDNEPLVVFYTDADQRVSSFNGVYAFRFRNGQLQPFPLATDGIILAESGVVIDYWQGFPQSISLANIPEISNTPADAPRLLASFPGINPRGLYPSARAAVLDSTGLWQERAGSLSADGVSGTPTFQVNVRDVGAALDNFGNPFVTWSAGNEEIHSIFAARFRFGEWQGMAGSDVTPIAAGSGDSIPFLTNWHPKIAVAAGVPVVAWTAQEGTLDYVKLLEYDAASDAWQEVAGSNQRTGLGNGRMPQLAVFEDSANYFLAYEQRSSGALTVLRRTADGFEDYGDPLAPWGVTRMITFDARNEVPETGFEPNLPAFSITTDRAGQLMVAFRAEFPMDSGSSQILASYRNNFTGQWEALGDPTAEGNTGTVSALSYVLPDPEVEPENWFGHYAPSIYRTLDNVPIIAWEFDDGTPQTPVIFMKTYDSVTADLPVTTEQAVRKLLDFPEFNRAIDDNRDEIYDAADVERLRSRGL